MEQKFLMYLLYSTLVEIRAKAYENKDKRLYWLTSLLHNIPFALGSEDSTRTAYKDLIQNVKQIGIDNWLDEKMKEFIQQFPQYK